MARIDAETTGVYDAGNSKTIELGKELLGPGDIVLETRPGESLEQCRDADDGAGEPAGGFA